MIKGGVIGLALFVLFLFLWYPRFIQGFGIPKGTQYAISPSIVLMNAQFLAGLLLSFGAGLAVVGFWPKAH